MLKTIRLAQIGDIHLPSSGAENQRNAGVDHKDPKFPPRIKNIITRTPLKTVFRRVFSLMEDNSFDAILFMGDFTDFGDLAGYEACSKFIANSLQIGRSGKYSALQVGIVPGNHDVDRVGAKSAPLSGKFSPLNQVLNNDGLPVLPLIEPILVPVTKGDVAAAVFLTNSCWGCGEEEFIPEFFREPIAKAIADTFAGADGDKARRFYYDRQLDTPAISLDTISRLVNAIDALPQSNVAMIVGHHNLFPQRLPRLAPYTELVNSGALRRSLIESKRPIIFLHGHIHDDPIEILSEPNGQPLIVVSAPEASAGFNIIELTFTNHNTPLICSITPYRFDNSGVLKIRDKIRVPLIGRRNRSSMPKFAEFYAELLRVGQGYWKEIVSIAGDKLGIVNNDEIVEQLELLHADERITIANHDLPCENWIIRASI